MDTEDKLTVFIVIKNVGFNDNVQKTGLKSARMKDALYVFPKGSAKVQKPSLPAIENIEDSSDLQGEGVKTIIPSIIIVIYTRLEILPGLKLSGYTDTLTEASKLLDELYKRGKIQTEWHYRNALDKFQT